MNTFAAETWTTRQLLRWMIDYFTEKEIDAPRLCAEMLLADVLGCDRMRLYMEVDRPASEAERATLRAYVQRAAGHEPVQYILGEAMFYGRAFRVSPCTLIPRPCTETVVEACVRLVRADGPDQPVRLLDIGTGTGCIAVTLLKELPTATAIATDLDWDAIDLAGKNAERHEVQERIEFRTGSLYEPLTEDDAGSFDVICSNPPYIPDCEWKGGQVGRNVKGHEPDRALRGGADGLEFIRPIVEQADRWLTEDGVLLVEIAAAARDAAVALADATSWCGRFETFKDGDGLWRALVMFAL